MLPAVHTHSQLAWPTAAAGIVNITMRRLPWFGKLKWTDQISIQCNSTLSCQIPGAHTGVHIGKVMIDTTNNPQPQATKHCLAPKAFQEGLHGEEASVPSLTLEPTLRFECAFTLGHAYALLYSDMHSASTQIQAAALMPCRLRVLECQTQAALP